MQQAGLIANTDRLTVGKAKQLLIDQGLTAEQAQQLIQRQYNGKAVSDNIILTDQLANNINKEANSLLNCNDALGLNTQYTNANSGAKNGAVSKGFKTKLSANKLKTGLTVGGMAAAAIGSMALKDTNAGTFLTNIGTGVSTGAMIGGPWGAAAGLALGLANAIGEVNKNSEKSKEEIKQAGEEAKQNVKQIKSDFDNLSSTVNETKQRYAELAQGVKNLGKANQSQGKLSTDEYKEFLELSDKLADLFPQLKTGFEDNGQAILDLSGNVDTIVGSLNDLVNVERKISELDILKNVDIIFKENILDIGSYADEQVEYETKKNFANDALTILNGTKYEDVIDSKDLTYDQLDLWDEFIREAYKRADLEFNGSIEELSDKEKQELRRAINNIIDEYEVQIKANEQKIKTSNQMIAQNLIFGLGSEIDELSPELKNLYQGILNNTDFNDIKFSEGLKPEVYARKLLSQLKSAGLDSEFTEAWTELMSIDEDASLKNNIAIINRLIPKLAKYLGMKDNELKIALGIDTDNMQSDLNNARNRLGYSNNKNKIVGTKVSNQTPTYTDDEKEDNINSFQYSYNLDDKYKSYNGINNINRNIITWDENTLNKYKNFIIDMYGSFEEGVEDLDGTWSTVLGDVDEDFHGISVAYSNLFDNGDELIPLTSKEIDNYLETLYEQVLEKNNGKFNVTDFIELDKQGTKRFINGQVMTVSNMIAAAEGQFMDFQKLTADDVMAIATPGYLLPKDNNSIYKGYSMHEVQENALNRKYIEQTAKQKVQNNFTETAGTTAHFAGYERDENGTLHEKIVYTISEEQDEHNNALEEFLGDISEAEAEAIANLDQDLIDKTSMFKSKEEYEKWLEELKAEGIIKVEVDIVTPLATIEKDLKSLQGIYDQIYNYDDDKENKIVSAEDLAGLDEVFGAIEDGNPLEEFKRVLTEMPGDTEAAQHALDVLITAYVDSSGILDNLTEENAEYTTQLLKSIGVQNADVIVQQRLNKEIKKDIDNLKKFSKASKDNVKALKDNIANGKDYSKNLSDVKENLKDILTYDYTNENGIEEIFSVDVSDDFILEHLKDIEAAANGDIEALYKVRDAASEEIVANFSIDAPTEQATEGIRNQINSLIDGFDINSVEVGAILDDTPMIQGLNSLVYAGQLTRDNMNKILSGIGVYPDEESVTKTITYTDYSQPGHPSVTSTITVPAFNYKVKPRATNTNYGKVNGFNDSNSGGGGGGGSDDNKSKETYDWIEVRIGRLEDKISDLDAIGSDTFENLALRAYAYGKEIDDLTEEIDTQQKAYQRYMQEANNVGLDEEWAEKVRNGEIDIDTIEDEELKDKISRYTEWYNKARDSMRSIKELGKTKLQKELERIQLFIDNLDQALSRLDDVREDINRDINNQYRKTTAKDYDKSINNYNVRNATLERQNEYYQQQLDALEKAGKKDSQEYKDIQKQMTDNIQEIADNEISKKDDIIAKIQLKIDVDETELDKLDKKIQKIQSRVAFKEGFGFTASEKDYKDMSSAYGSQINWLNLENESLVEQQKQVEKGSKAWKDYQDKIDANNQKIQDCLAGIQETSKSLANMPLEKAAKKNEKLANSYSILEAKVTNATATWRKNALIDQEVKVIDTQEKNTTNAHVQAVDNVNTTQGTLKSLASKGYKQTKNAKEIQIFKDVWQKVNARQKIPEELIQRINTAIKNAPKKSQRLTNLNNLLIYAIRWNAYLDAEEESEYNAKIAIEENAQKRYSAYTTQRDNTTSSWDTASSAATGGLHETVGAKNSSLDEQIQNYNRSNDAYYKVVKDTYGDLKEDVSGSQNSITSALKKASGEYRTALKDAEKCINSKQTVPDKVLNIIKKYNVDIYDTLIRYNADLENYKNAKYEASVQYAANSAAIYNAKREKVNNEIADEDRQDTLFNSKEGNENTAKDKNLYVDKKIQNVYDRRDIYSKDTQSAKTDFTNKQNSIKKLTTSNIKANTASDSSWKLYKGFTDDAIASVKKGERISDNILANLLKGVENGAITVAFYQKCIDYNNSYEYLQSAKQTEELYKETSKADLRQLGQEKLDNIKKEYQNKLNKNDTKFEERQAKIALNNTKGYETTADEYKGLILNRNTRIGILEEQRDALKERIIGNLSEGIWEEGSQEYKDAMRDLESLDNQIINLTKDVEEYTNQLNLIKINSLQKIKENLDATADKYSSIVSLIEKIGSLTREDYLNSNKKTDALNDQLKAEKSVLDNLKTQLGEYELLYKAAKESGVYGGQTAEYWKQQMDNTESAINSQTQTIQDTYDAIREASLETYKKISSEINSLITKLDKLKDLMSDMNYNKDGYLTQWGVATMGINLTDYNKYLEDVKNIQGEIQKIKSDFNTHATDEDGNIIYSYEEYIEAIEDAQGRLLDAAKSAQSAQNEVFDMLKQVAQAHLDQINELIDAYGKALDKKKAYYEYDKTLKEKNKNIQNLESEIQALEGITDAASKAKRAQLEEQLSEAKQDLDDTTRDHYYETITSSLDDFKEMLQEEFDDKWGDIAYNTQKQAELLESANSLISDSGNGIIGTLNALLKHFGVNPVKSGLSDTVNTVGKYAKGSKKITKSGMSLTNEAGREIVVTKNGILMPLEYGDGVVPNKLTERLFEMAKNGNTNMPIINLPDINVPNPTMNSNANITQNYDALIRIEGSADAATVADLKKMSNDLLKASYEYTSKKIYNGYVKAGGTRRA